MKQENKKQKTNMAAKGMGAMFRVLLACFVAVCLTTGCGASYDGAKYETSEPAYDTAAGLQSNATAAIASDELYESEGDWGEMEDAMPAEAPAAENGTTENMENSVASNRKLIKRVNMTAETQDFDTLVARIDQKVKALGGYMEDSSVYGNSYAQEGMRSANFTARVPADRMDELVVAVSDASNVTSKSESATDVTLNYVDTKSRKEALQVEYERLMALLDKAEDIDTIVALETRLTNVRYEIQNLESTLRTYDNLVDFATVHISVEEVKVYTEEVTKPKTGWERMSEGFLRSIWNIAYDLENFAIGFVIRIPYLIVWGIIIGVIFLIVRGIIKSRRKKKEKRTQLNQTAKEPMISLDNAPQEETARETQKKEGGA